MENDIVAIYDNNLEKYRHGFQKVVDKLVTVTVLLAGNEVEGMYKVRIKNVCFGDRYKIVFLGIVEDAICCSVDYKNYGGGYINIEGEKYDIFTIVVGDAYNKIGNIKGKYMFIEVYATLKEQFKSINSIEDDFLPYLEAGKDEQP